MQSDLLPRSWMVNWYVFFSEGTYFRCNENVFHASEIIGNVVDVDVENGIVSVELKGTNQVSGRYDWTDGPFSNSNRTTVHPNETVHTKNGQLIIKLADDLLIGRLKIQEIANHVIRTNTSMTFTADYPGASLLNEQFEQVATLKHIRSGVITLEDGYLREDLHTGDVMWICNVGLGDEIVIKSLFEWIE